MNAATAFDVVAAARRQNETIRVELNALAEVERAHQLKVRRVDAELEDAWQYVGEALLPRLDVDVLDRAAHAVSLHAIGSRDVRERMAADEREQREWVTETDANDDYVHREARLNELAIQLAELDDSITPLRAEMAAIVQEPMWRELLSAGYGTPGYPGRFWELSYYRHWQRGDIVVELYGPRWNAADFPTLRAKVEDAQRALGVLDEERAGLARRKTDIETLVAARKEAEAALRELGPRALNDARARARAHLEPLDDAALATLLASDETTKVAAARIAGVRAKKQYLLALHKELIDGPRKALQRAMGKNQKDINKLQRPKNAYRTMPRAEFERRFQDKSEWLKKRRERWQEASDRIVTFDRYDRWQPARDFLWWDVMTDGRIDGDFMPDVREHHRAHGGYERAQAAVLEEQRAFSSSDVGAYDAS